MAAGLPEIRPISELARDARGLVERARSQREPIVITQRGRDVAVLVPIDLYRELERRTAARIASPRLVSAADADRFRVTVTRLNDKEVGSG